MGLCEVCWYLRGRVWCFGCAAACSIWVHELSCKAGVESFSFLELLPSLGGWSFLVLGL